MPLFRVGGKLVHFVHIPKTGGTSVVNFFKPLGPIFLHHPYRQQQLNCPPQHFHRAMFETVIPPNGCDYTFTIVRHPFDRIVSEYRWDKRRRHAVPPFFVWWSECRRAYRRDQLFLQNHIRPQIEFLSPGIKVFRFEQGLQGIIDLVCADLRVPSGAVPHIFRSPTDFVTVDPRSRESVTAFYAKDFAELGYDADDAGAMARSHCRLGKRSLLAGATWYVTGGRTTRQLLRRAKKRLLPPPVQSGSP